MGEEQKLTLKGISVADFSHALSAPYGSMLLGDQGADIIKIENPQGDVFRTLMKGAYAAVVHRNKRTISLNLKLDEGKAVARKIVEKADVLIENFTPGAFDRLGFGYEEVKKYNPRIIYCSLSGYGQTGSCSKLGGYDVVAQAISGIMDNTGEAGRLPVRIGPSIIDMGSGMYLAMGILLALMDREKTGKGQRIELSLMETALSWMSAQAAYNSMTGEVPQRFGSGFFPFCPYKVYEAEDQCVFIGVSTNKFWEKFCKEFDLMDLYEREDFKNASDRVAKRDELDGLVQDSMKKLKAADIINRLRKAGIPCSPVNNIQQAIAEPQAIERGCIGEDDHPTCGKIKFVKNPINRDGKFPELRFSSPIMGQHSRDIMAELGYTNDEVEGLISSGAVVVEKK
ncbi:MAG: CoA transferase [Deltaproteobacteria bacterium]|nr:CoA transferase [Deltaproteobacteria bacterium]